MLSILQVVAYSIHQQFLWSLYCAYPHFTNDEAKAQKDKTTFPSLHSRHTTKKAFKPSHPTVCNI